MTLYSESRKTMKAILGNVCTPLYTLGCVARIKLKQLLGQY